MLAFPGLQLIDDLRAPGAFGNEGAVIRRPDRGYRRPRLAG
jgi:hypothetical protein